MISCLFFFELILQWLFQIPIDLTSAGTRALATLDSVADLQSSLKLVNEHFRNYQLATNAMNTNISKIPLFIKHNPTIEAEWQLPPVSNLESVLPTTKPHHITRPGHNNFPNWSHPAARDIQLDNSKIFRSSMPLWCLISDRNSINNFIWYSDRSHGYHTVLTALPSTRCFNYLVWKNTF